MGLICFENLGSVEFQLQKIASVCVCLRVFHV